MPPDILQNIDIGALLLLSIGCVFLCVIGLLVFFGFQILGTSFAVLGSIVELVSGIIEGGPVAWCGCLIVLLGCVGCAGVALLASTCSANPNAMNFCLLF